MTAETLRSDQYYEKKLVLVLQYNILVDIYIKTQQEQQTQVD